MLGLSFPDVFALFLINQKGHNPEPKEEDNYCQSTEIREGLKWLTWSSFWYIWKRTLLIRWCLQASHQCRRQLANKALFCGGFSVVFSCYQVISHLWFTSERAYKVQRRKMEPNKKETGLSVFPFLLGKRKFRHPCLVDMTCGKVFKYMRSLQHMLKSNACKENTEI